MHSGLLPIAVYVIHTQQELTHARLNTHPHSEINRVAKVYLRTDSFVGIDKCSKCEVRMENEGKKHQQQQCQYNNNNSNNNNHDDENEEKTA